MGPEKDSASEKSPGHHGPAARDMDPFFAGILHDQRAEGECERHGKSDIAQIKHGRMDNHLGILQQRIETTSVGPERTLEQAEGIRGEVDEREEEDLHCGEDDGRIGEEARVGFVAQAEDEAVTSEQERPEQQRTFLAGP